LDIAKALDIDARVVTDNDGDVEKLKRKFTQYKNSANIRLCYSADESLRTLEYHLLKVNGRDRLNRILDRGYASDDEMLRFMIDNKTDCALKIFDSLEPIAIPDYIERAIS
jgi:putative ATP-dependent endonuclease of the OLD family